MIIFNAFLFIFAAKFGGSGGQDISTASESVGWDITGSNFAYSVIVSGLGIFTVAGLATFFTRNVAWIGAGALGVIIFALYTAGTGNIRSMFETYPFAEHIWTIISFCFVVIAVIAIAEVFTGRSVTN